MAEKNEQSVREFAIQSLANDFLDVSDGNLDFRAYLVETTLPTVIIAMEKLLENVEKRNDIINSMTEVSSSSSPGSNSLSSSKSSFDPLNWLGKGV